MKILVVDDEEVLREFLCDLLASLGHQTIRATDGREGFETARAERPDLVISDIRMPVLDGLGLLEAVQKLPDAPPVILLTGYGDLESAIKALQSGAYDFMLKPVRTHELTARLAHIERERQLRSEAEEAKRRAVYNARMASIGQLAAGVAHEINNPTTYVRGNAQFLETLEKRLSKALESNDFETLREMADLLHEKMPELLEGIQRGTERIRKITQGLFHFSNSQSYEPERQVSLNACVEDALMLLGRPEPEVTLEKRLSSDIPLVKLSRRAVTQAVICLLMNANQAVSERETPHVRITTEPTEEKGARLVVEDNGPGIPENLRLRVFEPFFTTRDVNEGAGLGLSVAFGIVANEHGGDLRAEASPLGGARFVAEFPPEPVRANSATSPSPAQTAHAASRA